MSIYSRFKRGLFVSDGLSLHVGLHIQVPPLQAIVTKNKYFCSTVANIANNLNNNNNNQNDNNLNFVNQQNNNLNMNQNIINQLNIDLPPPVPGRRKRSGRDIQR